MIVYNGEVQSALNYLRNFNATDFTVGGNKNFKDAGTYELTLTPTNNVCWLDGTTSTRTLTYTVHTPEEFVEEYEDILITEEYRELSETVNTLATAIKDILYRVKVLEVSVITRAMTEEELNDIEHEKITLEGE
jgi:hypothetical protein